jgi:ketosteroid isomerase-like protein
VTTLTPSAPASASAPSSAAERWRAPRGPDAFAAHFRPMLAPDVRLLQPQLPTVTGVRGFEQRVVRPLFTLFPDIRGEVECWAAREDVLYIELTLRATLAGRPVSWRACDRVTLRDGLAVERESYFDPAPLLAAIARSPRAWPAFLRVQARSRISQLKLRRKS